MAYKVFISYSTKDFAVVDYVKNLLASPMIEVFVAEYSVYPSTSLSNSIVEAIKGCDLFVLLWSRNSGSSEWVPQEIGVACGASRTILPIVLEPEPSLPGFIRELKYLAAYQNPEDSLAWLQQYVQACAQQQQQAANAMSLLAVSGLILLLLGQRDKERNRGSEQYA